MMRRREKLTTEDATGHSRGSGDKLRWQEAAPALRAGPRSQKAERGLRQCSPPPAKPHGQGCRAARAHGRRLVAAARPISRPQCHASQDAHSALGSAVKGQVEALEGASSRPSELMEIHETTPPRCPLASNSPLEAVASCKQDLLAPSTWPLRSIHGRCVNVLSVTRLWQLWQTYHIRQSLLEHILGTKQCKQRSVKIATGGGL